MTIEEALSLARAETNPYEAAFGFAYVAKAQRKLGVDPAASIAAAIDRARAADEDSESDYLLVAIASSQADAGDLAGALATADLVKEKDHKVGVLARIIPRTPPASTKALEQRIAAIKASDRRGMLWARLAEVRARAGTPVPKDPFGGVTKPEAKGYLWLATAHAHLGDAEAATAAAKACRGDPRPRALELAAAAWARAGDLKKALAIVKPVKDDLRNEGRTHMLIAIAGALRDREAVKVVLADARAATAEMKFAREHLLKDIAAVELRVGMRDEGVADLEEAAKVASAASPVQDPWIVLLDAARSHPDPGRAAELARAAGIAAAKDDWTAERWASHGTPYAWDPVWKVCAAQASIDARDATRTAHLRSGARRAAALAETIAQEGGKRRS